MHSVPEDDFTLLSGNETLSIYTFNSHTIAHQFCTQCGIQPFAAGSDREGNTIHVINVHCLKEPRYDKNAISHFNGADF